MNIFFRQTLAFLKRNFIETLSYKLSFFFEFAGGFFHLLIFYFIAKLFGQNAGPYLHLYGGEYFPFVLIGIVFISYQTSALSSLPNAVARELGHGTLEAIFMTPAKPIQLVLTVAFGDLVLTSMRTVLFLALAAAFFGVDISSMNVPAVVGMVLMTIASFLGFGLISAGFLLAFKRGDPIRLILNAVTKLLGGVYFPMQMLPEWCQNVSSSIPFTHALEGLRKAILQGKSLSDLHQEIAYLSIVAVVMIPAGLIFFNRMVDYAKKEGTLAFA